MTSLDDPALSSAERRVLETALRTDPELAEELELITGMLDPDARQRFWKALARECVRRDRPAAAVLAALEFAARHPG
ncbi:MAG: hypothetical protein H0V25_05025 [Solirubrobacterales bacterium]|nr:hypothetical protein [Solirubrobacterales bacterium]